MYPCTRLRCYAPRAMLSSIGLDTKFSSRGMRNGSSKYFDVPRGFSVHVFKSSTPSAHPHNAVETKPEYDLSRPSNDGRSMSAYVGSDRKPLTHPGAYRITQPAVYVDSQRPKSTKPYGIYHNPSAELYVLEPSISSASDLLATSPSSSSSSSDSDIFSESVSSASMEISSTRASSSTETLEATALTIQYTRNPPRPNLPRSSSSSDRARVNTDGSRIPPPGLPASYEVPHRLKSGRSVYPAGPVYPSPLMDDLDDETDTETYINEEEEDEDVILPPGRPLDVAIARDVDGRNVRYIAPQPTPAPLPMRRYSDERPNGQQIARPARILDDTRAAPFPAGSGPTQYVAADPAAPRVPPGLPTNVIYATGGGSMVPPPASSSIPVDARPRRPSFSRTWSSNGQAVVQLPAVPAARQNDANVVKISPPSSQQGVAAQDLIRQTNQTLPGQASSSGSNSEGGLTVATRRCVRWTEDLMCPCPVPRSERRKGWFNRRGDQLWTNDGKFKSSEPGKEYPPDLMGYPEPNSGWMNEEGVRIDMQHHLIPKPPLRSALKRPKANPSSQ